MGGGAGADLGAGAGHSRGHGWSRPPPPKQPETEARPWGLVPGWGALGQGRGAVRAPAQDGRLTGRGPGEGGVEVGIREQSAAH